MVNPRHISALPLPHCGKSSFGDRQHHDRQGRWKSLSGEANTALARERMDARSVRKPSILKRRKFRSFNNLDFFATQGSDAVGYPTTFPVHHENRDTHRGWLVCVFPGDSQRCRDSIEDGPCTHLLPRHRAAAQSRRSRGALGPAAAVSERTHRPARRVSHRARYSNLRAATGPGRIRLRLHESVSVRAVPAEIRLSRARKATRVWAARNRRGARGFPLPHAPGSGRTGAGLSRTQCVRREHINARAITHRRRTDHAEFRGVARFGVLRRGQPAVRRRRRVRRKPWTGSIPRCARNCACSGPRPNTRRTRSRRMRACPPA